MVRDTPVATQRNATQGNATQRNPTQAKPRQRNATQGEESELVSGFMTEHAAVIFVFFFLAEYASIVLICTLTSILFLGGYLINFAYVLYLIKAVDPYLYLATADSASGSFFSDPLVEGAIYGLTLGLKACAMIFLFI